MARPRALIFVAERDPAARPELREDTGRVFAAPGGGFIDLNNFRRREWSPAFEAAGLPRRRIYDLRHAYAAFALDAGISIFELSRFMVCGVRVIDRTYGHLVIGSETRAREKLEARAARGIDTASIQTTGIVV